MQAQLERDEAFQYARDKKHIEERGDDGDDDNHDGDGDGDGDDGSG